MPQSEAGSAPGAELQAEAEWLATRSTAERVDYLFEVAHLPSRGPDAAEQLQRLVGQILARRRLAG